MSDDELFEGLSRLAEEDRALTKDFLAHLAVIDERPACAKKGFPSIFAYCTQRLGLSEAMAYWRIYAARKARQFDIILDLVEQGVVTLTNIVIIGPHLKKHNHVELLDRIKGKTRKEVEMIAAALAPQPPRKDSVTPVSVVAKATAEWIPTSSGAPMGELRPTEGHPITFSFDKIEAVDGQRQRLHFDVGPETARLLERAKEVLSHKFPMASFEDIVKEALTLLLAEKDPEITLKLEKENAKEVLTASRRVPVWVRRKVWRRDGGRCAYIAEDGTRCQEKRGLEFDHVIPYAKGGRSDDPANVRLLCRAHNQLNGWLAFPAATSSA